MINPFQYGAPVVSDEFCNRLRERDAVRLAVEAAESLLLVGGRGSGTTSLALRALTELPAWQVLPVYVDLSRVDGPASLIEAAARAVTAAAAPDAKDRLEMGRSLFRVLAPVAEPAGDARERLRYPLPDPDLAERAIEDVLAAASRLAQRQRRRLVLVWDGLDRLAAAVDDDRLARSVVSGSRALADSATLFVAGPRAASRWLSEPDPLLPEEVQRIEVGPIGSDHWVPFVRTRFIRARKIIEKEMAVAVCERTGGHPYYTQFLFHTLWEVTEPDQIASSRLIDLAVELLLARASTGYRLLLDSLTANQRRLLGALAREPGSKALFSGRFLRSSGFGSASSVQRAVASLLERELLSEQDGSLELADPFLKRWLCVGG